MSMTKQHPHVTLANSVVLTVVFLLSLSILHIYPLTPSVLRISPFMATTRYLNQAPPDNTTPTTQNPQAATLAAPHYANTTTAQDQPDVQYLLAAHPTHPPALPSSRTPPAACDIAKGEWVYDPDAVPYYTNSTCWTIEEEQNCIKNGRPDTDYLKWRWKLNGGDRCELRPFNPAEFLEMMRGKSMLFVGDSLARNQLKSLMCILSQIEHPENLGDVLPVKTNEARWHYASHNFTLASIWSPYLIRTVEVPESMQLNWTRVRDLHLDEIDERWASKIHEFNYMVISAGVWLINPAIFTVNQTIIGSNTHIWDNITEMSRYYGHRKAFDTVFRTIASREGSERVTTVFRTITPAHYENGDWYDMGECPRIRPSGNGGATFPSFPTFDRLYRDQLKEFNKAWRMGKKKKEGLDWRLLDVTEAMHLRPDGHPGLYGRRWKYSSAPNDCLHWCIPGPVDMWNDLLLHVLKM